MDYNKKARVIAFYLPQFHPIPENDEWWGKGFTEWTNVGKAKPLFKGHYQPRVPADLGYYDLRLAEVREAQAEMAKEAGIEGFMYWHYWFGNKRTILDRPFREVLESGSPNFPFCLGWANHTWSNRTWDTKSQYNVEKILIEQKYLGEADYTEHFYHVLPAFKDDRYITVDSKPIFLIYSPNSFEDVTSFIKTWQNLAIENGLEGIYFIGQTVTNFDSEKIISKGFNAVCRTGILDVANHLKGKFRNKVMAYLRHRVKVAPLNTIKYSDIVKNLIVNKLDIKEYIHPTIIPNFDHSPRSGRKGLIYTGSTPELFRILTRKAIEIVKNKKREHRIIFLRSWNEWAEGNYVEPDLVHGKKYLEVLKDEIFTKEF